MWFNSQRMENTSLQSTLNETSEQSALKRGRGRPSGSNSFENVQIKQLLGLLSPEASIPVSKKWLRDTLGLMASERPIQTITYDYPIVSQPVETEEVEEKVQFAMHSFEE
jgi:hypothetical protein